MRKDIRERIKLIKEGKVPEGYKKTKLGIIPKDWEIVQIKDILEKVEKPVQVDKDLEYTQIGIRSHGKGIFYKEPVTGKELGNKRVFWVEPNCFIVNIVFAWEQAVSKTTENELGYIASHRFPMYRPINGNVTVDYLVQYFLTKTGKEILEAASPGGAGRNRTLGQERFMNSRIISPMINEQHVIAQILKCQNQNIILTEKEIEKKYKLKKYLMQNLLYGKKRLSGFSHGWKKSKLKSFLIEVNERNKLMEISKVKSVNNRRGFIDQSDQFSKNVASSDLSNYKIVKKGNIAYNPSRINVGSIALYNENDPGIISPMYIVFKTKSELDEKYLMYYLRTEKFNQSMNSYLSGSVRESLKYDDLCAVRIILPDRAEQEAIVNVLEAFDKEITLLEQKLELIKKEQKVMMQLLLTGIVRVNDL